MKLNMFFICLPLFLWATVSCEKQDLVEYPVAETYVLLLKGQSLAGELEVLLDGEVKWSGRRLQTINPERLLLAKGKRKLEIREMGKTEILKTYTLDPNEKKDYNINFYWNGEKVTEELELPTPSEGKFGFIMKLSTPISGRTDPMDIEFFLTTTSYFFDEILATIKGYVPGSGDYSEFVELDPIPAAAPGIPTKLLGFRFKKAGTDEPYYEKTYGSAPSVMEGGVVTDPWYPIVRFANNRLPIVGKSGIVDAVESKYTALTPDQIANYEGKGYGTLEMGLGYTFTHTNNQ